MVLLKKIGNYIWSKQFAINLGVIILIYVIGFILLNKCLDSQTKFGEKVAVPNLVGKNQNNLKKILGDSLEFEILGSIYDPSKIEGLRILVDYDLEGNEGIIGMGDGPTFTKINF